MKRILLTGASDWLGKEIGMLCVEKWIQVVALCRTQPNYPCDFIATDLTDEKSMTACCDSVKNSFPDFSVLINCAGVPGIQKPNEITYAVLDTVMKINTLAPMFLSSQLFDLITKNETDILNVGSTIGLKQGHPNELAYTTSKRALRGVSSNLQLEFKNSKSRTIQFNIGGMNTRMHEKNTGRKIDNPDERMDPAEIAKIVLYILELPKQIEISEITINRKIV